MKINSHLNSILFALENGDSKVSLSSELYKSNYLRTGNNTYFYAIGFADNLINKLIQIGKYDMF